MRPVARSSASASSRAVGVAGQQHRVADPGPGQPARVVQQPGRVVAVGAAEQQHHPGPGAAQQPHVGRLQRPGVHVHHVRPRRAGHPVPGLGAGQPLGADHRQPQPAPGRRTGQQLGLAVGRRGRRRRDRPDRRVHPGEHVRRRWSGARRNRPARRPDGPARPWSRWSQRRGRPRRPVRWAWPDPNGPGPGGAGSTWSSARPAGSVAVTADTQSERRPPGAADARTDAGPPARPAARLPPGRAVLRAQVDRHRDRGAASARTTIAEWAQRVRRLATVLDTLDVSADGRVGTFCWNTGRHLELYLAAPCTGRVLHTLNIRLFPEQLVYIANHAEDEVVFVDRSLLPLFWPLTDKLETVRHIIVIDDGADVADPGRPAGARLRGAAGRGRAVQRAVRRSTTRTERPPCATRRAPPATRRAWSTATARRCCTR